MSTHTEVPEARLAAAMDAGGWSETDEQEARMRHSLAAVTSAIRVDILSQLRSELLSVESTRPLVEAMFGPDHSASHYPAVEEALNSAFDSLELFNESPIGVDSEGLDSKEGE